MVFVGADKVIHDDDRLVDRVDKIKGSGELRELPRTLYHNEIAHFMIPFLRMHTH